MTILYTGTDPSHFRAKPLVHCPLIEVIERDWQLPDISRFSHFVLTSKNAVKIFAKRVVVQDKIIVAVGKATARALEEAGWMASVVAEDACQEGIVAEFEKMDLTRARVCLPRSSGARDVIDRYLEGCGIEYEVIALYDVKTSFPKKLPDLDSIEKVVFTSPSTVRAFIEIFGSIPCDKELIAIGPITYKALKTAIGEKHGANL